MRAVEIGMVLHYSLSVWNIIFASTAPIRYESLQIYAMFEVKVFHLINVLPSSFCVHTLFTSAQIMK